MKKAKAGFPFQVEVWKASENKTAEMLTEQQK